MEISYKSNETVFTLDLTLEELQYLLDNDSIVQMLPKIIEAGLMNYNYDRQTDILRANK